MCFLFILEVGEILKVMVGGLYLGCTKLKNHVFVCDDILKGVGFE